MKQLVVTGSFPYYNHTFVNHQVASTLAAGHDVQILAPCHGDALGESEAACLGIPRENRIYLDCCKSPLFTPDLMRFSSPIRAAANQQVFGRKLAERRKSFFCTLARRESLRDLDIIHAHFAGWAYEVALPLGNLLRVPVTVTIHNGELPNMQPDYLRAIHEQAARIVLVSEEWKRIWIEKTGRTDKLAVVPNGVDLTDHRHPAPGEQIRLITVSRLVPGKRVQDGLMAIRRLLDLGVDCRYDIVGEGGEAEALKRLATELDLGDRVAFHGILPNSTVKAMMAESSILLHPSESESFGVVVIEGMSASLPVVVGNSKPMAEILEHGVSGFMYPPGDVERMTSHLADLCASPERRLAMGNAGQEVVEARYAWDIHMRRMFDLWDGAIKDRLLHASAIREGSRP
jgi:glycosyltransferase involved in cell wall biosynthesis